MKSLRRYIQGKRNIVTIIERFKPEDSDDRKCLNGILTNTHKLKLWNEFVQRTNDDIVLCDADMFCRGDFSEVFWEDFDIGYTKRTEAHAPFNGGVIFVKNTEKAKQFMSTWTSVNLEMVQDKEFHEEWVRKYPGINQTSFGYLLEHKKLYSARLKHFPCSIYNACMEDWENYKEAKLIHINNYLRNDLLSMHLPIYLLQKEVRPIAKEWRLYEFEQ